MLRIGKKDFGWNSTKFRLAGFASERITAIDFGEKITDELVRGNRRDGTPQGVTGGEYEADIVQLKMLIGEWFGEPGNGRVGYLTRLTLGKTVGLSDIECDMGLQFFEELVGVCDIYFPVCRIVGAKLAATKGNAPQEMDVSVRPIEPLVTNGTKLASIVRAFSGV